MKANPLPAELSQYLRLGIKTSRSKLFVQASFWTGALFVGIFAVYFARFIEALQFWNLTSFHAHPYFMSALTPFAFLAAAAVVKFFALHAGGSGIPQSLYAASIARRDPVGLMKSGMVSIRTGIVKVISTGISFIGGASVGGEGPTVQISTAIFAASGNSMRKIFPGINLQSYLVAGAGAGIAAAFNTPLGGVSFAIEEVALSEFGDLKHLVMLSVIIAGLVAQALIGSDTLYLGNPMLGVFKTDLLPWAAFIGIIGGLLGAFFAKLVSSNRLYHLNIKWWKKALACGVIVAGINLIFKDGTSGNGYETTRNLMTYKALDQALMFPIAKLFATAISTLSGLGGGILAPSLSIGAWMGVSASKILQIATPQTCALLGMVAYLTGAFQIPLTSVIIVMEMTNQNGMIIPMMVTAVASFAIAKTLTPVSLYHKLIERSYHLAVSPQEANINTVTPPKRRASDHLVQPSEPGIHFSADTSDSEPSLFKESSDHQEISDPATPTLVAASTLKTTPSKD